MPVWESGLVGYVRGNDELVDKIFSDVKYFCYVQTLNLVELPFSKKLCLFRIFSKYEIEKVIFRIDLYGIANKYGTRYGVKREVIIDIISKYFSRYLIENNYVDKSFKNYIDEELKILKKYIPYVETHRYSIIAQFVASCPLISKRSNGKYRLDNYEVSIEVLDLVPEVESYVNLELSKAT